MTAEIAIINKSAVTLATDSAVTIKVRGAEKIYNCADKLFELSDRDPMGIMVYNNLQFMGIPLEVVAKQFRQRIALGHYNSVFDAAAAFFNYLQHDLAPDVDLQKQYAKSMLTSFLFSIRNDFQRAVLVEFQKTKNRKDYPVIFTEVIQKRISELEATGTSECFAGMTEQDIIDFYGDVFGAVIEERFNDLPLTDEHKGLLSRACTLLLIRDEFSESLTGVVFAGFGEHDTFPSLVAYELDGMIANKLKRRETAKVTTSRSGITGEILPFAQREMVDRFLYGIDPQFEDGIEVFIENIVKTVGNGLIQLLPRANKGTKAKLADNVRVASEIAVRSWREKMAPTVKSKFMQEVQDMIYLMPKQELATLAQELINLTSVKRKFSSGKESVGGPIDVAVISRIDGFVWVRRKHYFEPSLNPRYFHRKFGQPQA